MGLGGRNAKLLLVTLRILVVIRLALVFTATVSLSARGVRLLQPELDQANKLRFSLLQQSVQLLLALFFICAQALLSSQVRVLMLVHDVNSQAKLGYALFIIG